MKKRRLILIGLIVVLLLLLAVLWDCRSADTQAAPRAAAPIEPIQTEPIDTASPSPILPTTTPTAAPPQETKTPSPKREGEVLFGLKIHGETISVAPNVEEDTLEEMPGWLTTSAMPGEWGMCVIYGHRNRDHLKVLKHVEIGDPITAILKDGTEHTYTVTDIQIHESTDTLRLPTMDGDSIVLVTCYPFRYTGHAPGKYVVVGKCI